MRFANVLAVVILLAPARSPVAAQQHPADAAFPMDSAADDSLTEIFRLAEHDRSYLRLTTESQSVYSGYVFRVVADSQWVHIGARRANYPAIELVELRHKERTGGLVGALLGATALGIVGYNLESECDVFDEDSRVRSVPCVAGWPLGVAGALLGSMVGTLAGVLIDPGSTRWEEVWREAE